MMKFTLQGQAKAEPKVEASVERLLEGDKDGDKCPLFQEVIKAFKYKFLFWDLSHMHLTYSTVPRNHDGDAKTDQAEVDKYTGSWTKQDRIFINPDMSGAMKFYGIEGKVTAEDLTKQAIAHELAHEIWKYQLGYDCKENFLRKANDLKFDTPYLHHIDDDDEKEELFCEYLAYRVTGVWIKI